MTSVAPISRVLNPADGDMPWTSSQQHTYATNGTSIYPEARLQHQYMATTSPKSASRSSSTAATSPIRPKQAQLTNASVVSSSRTTLEGHITKLRAAKRQEHKAQEQARRERLKLALERLDSLMTERRLSDASSASSASTDRDETADSPSRTGSGRGGAFAAMYIKARTVERAIEYIAALQQELDRAQGRLDEMSGR